MFKKIEEKHNRKFIRRAVLIFLLLLSFAMSSGTFAYWANHVEGTSTGNTMTFTVGSYTFNNYDFILNGEFDQGTFLIDTATLVNFKTPTGNTIDVSFGAIWEDSTIVNEDGTETIAYIAFSYEVYSEVNGSEISSRDYRKVNRILEVDFDIDNPNSLVLNDSTQTFGITIGLNQNGRGNDYKFYDTTDTYIIVHYEILYHTTGPTSN